jgi:predicted permease
VGDLWQDLTYGARILRKRAGFATIAVLTVALGIGATTAIFSAVNAILLQPLPLKDASGLVLFSDSPSEGTSTGSPRADVWERYSFASYRHFAGNVPAFEGVAAFRSGEDRLGVRQEGQDEVALASGHLVSGNFFGILHQEALLGRPLGPEDDREGADPAAVVSYGYWQEHLGASRSAVGRRMTLNGVPVTVVGVMPRSFFGLRVRRAADFWLPLHLQARIERRDDYLPDRDVYWLNLVARLAPGRTLQEAQAQVDVALAQYLRSHSGPEPAEDWKQAIARARIALAPGARGISGLRTYYGEALALLMAAAGFVLLIACANLTHLLLSRAVERRSEIAMRLALGAGRGRLIRQLLTESLLLAALGGVAGLLLALWGVEGLKTLVSKTSPVEVGLSLPVLLFAAAVSIVSGLLFGLAPARRAARQDLVAAMRRRVEGFGGGRLRFGLAPLLVATQVALSAVLLVSSGLLARTLQNLARADCGFGREGVVLLDIDTRIAGLETGELSPYYQRLLERLRAIPAVTSATVVSFSPMNGIRTNESVVIEGVAARPGDEMDVDLNRVGPGFASVFGLPLLRGRDFGDGDGPGAPRVALVSRAFMNAYFDGKDPIGRHVGLGSAEDRSPADIAIVGVVEDAKYDSPREGANRMLYLPILQAQDQSAYRSEVAIRTAAATDAVVPSLRRALGEVDGRVPLASVTTLQSQIDQSTGTERLLARLIGAFSALALLLSCAGLYGVVSQAVARRTNEVGIRMALGADRARIVSMVLGEAGTLVVAGLAVGLPAAAVAARLLGHQLYGVAPADPATLAASGLLLLGVALGAGYVPARRASRIEPLTALRTD